MVPWSSARRYGIGTLRRGEEGACDGRRPEGQSTFAHVNGLRTLLLRRVVACLALAGLVLPLAPVASAHAAATERLAEALGHREAVEIALAASQNAADPTDAFLRAYYEATGQNADEVLARFDGDALWLLTEPLAPTAVLVASGPATGALTALSGAVLFSAPRAALRADASGLAAPATPEASGDPSPLALQPRGP